MVELKYKTSTDMWFDIMEGKIIGVVWNNDSRSLEKKNNLFLV